MSADEAVISLDFAFEEEAFLKAAHAGGWPEFNNESLRPVLDSYLEQFCEDAVGDDLEGLSQDDVLQLAADFWAFARTRDGDGAQVRIRTGTGADGRTLDRDILEIVGDDRPFLVDSVMADIAAHGFDVLAMFHPIVMTARSDAGERIDGGQARAESMIQVHLAPLNEEQSAALEASVRETLADVRAAVEDWRPMRAEMEAAIEELESANAPAPKAALDEALEFLRWLRDDHFAFLGARTYRFVRAKKGGAPTPEMEDGSSLGVLRDPERHILRPKSEPVLTEDFLSQPTPVVVAKSNLRSRVHRRAIADYISVKRYSPDGDVVGERRFIGLFTAEAYNRMARDVPLVRQKVQYVLERAAKLPGSHNEKALRNIVENYPRDELFQISHDNLLKIALGVLHLEDRPRPRLFLRRDRFDRFISALVYLPRERYTADLRAEIGELLREAYDGRLSAYYPHFSDGPLARVQIIIGLEPGEHPEPDPQQLERAITLLARTWEDEFEQHLRNQSADAGVRTAAARYIPHFSAGYKEAFTPEEALADILAMEDLGPAPDIGVKAWTRSEDAGGVMRFKIYHREEPLPLSRVMPILETVGLNVIWEQGHRVACDAEEGADAPGQCVWIHDFEVHLPEGVTAEDDLRTRFEDAFVAVWRGYSEADRFNALILSAGATWRDAAFLRTIAGYRRQTGLETSQTVQEEALGENPEIARLLLALRDARLDPDSGLDMDARREKAGEIAQSIEQALDAVESLDFDRVLRRFLRVLQATLRTNYFQIGEDGGPANYISIKIASREIEALPEPKPFREIFVWAPHVEGVHLRFGPVARGGLRWSDRRDDFRTEVLGLVKAQQVKNAVIVPVGAKGGFYPKRLPKTGDRDAIREEAVRAYKTFIRSLLDITDNIEGGEITHPERVVMWDDDDPYLVVAADKGTATFSDIANGVAAEYGFWLGDAFASGGSAGYDHKAMGITARGAWEAVKRHFRELGKNIQSEPFSVIGVGDMSGDVFGNGMLLSKCIKLIAAFDHRDIFIDPEPDPEASWAERKRLFDLPRSSWQDYDKALISQGGGVFSRSEKKIALTAEIKGITGLTADAVTPAELMHALLKSPCELLWFGGIGTYVKASGEQNWQAGDKANDAVRVDGEQVRARVIGEGANLAVTQRGRIEFARAGGRINTDAVDNSAGVDTSDHEVNIKILLNGAIDDGKLAKDKRNALLEDMTEEVARHVLAHNYDQTLAISLSEDRAAEDLDAHERLMLRLEEAGLLNRAVENLPTTEEIAALREAGKGLTRPEIAVLIAYAKITLFDELVGSTVPDDPHFETMLTAYFPHQLGKFEDQMEAHRLHREIISTTLANDMINLGGATFANRVREMTGAESGDIARAFESARRIFGYDALTDRINALDNDAPAEAQTLLHRDTLRLLRRQTQWLARRGRGFERDAPRPVDETIAAYRGGVDTLKTILSDTMSDFQRRRMRARVAMFVKAGAPQDLAEDAAALLALTAATDIVDLAAKAEWSIEATAFLYHRVGGRFALDKVRAGADEQAPKEHWSRLAARRMIEALYSAQQGLTASVIDFAKQEGGAHAEGAKTPSAKWAGALLDAWIQHNAYEARRADAAIGDLSQAGGWTLSKVAIAETLYREFAELARP